MRAPALQLWWDHEPGGAEGLTARLDGARGVRLAVILEGRDLISALLVFESAAMRDAYAAWAPKHLLTPTGQAPTAFERLDSHTAAPTTQPA